MYLKLKTLFTDELQTGKTLVKSVVCFRDWCNSSMSVSSTDPETSVVMEERKENVHMSNRKIYGNREELTIRRPLQHQTTVFPQSHYHKF